MTKPKTVLPDTNVILRYLLADVPDQHAIASTFFEAVRDGRSWAVVLEGVVAECVYVLHKYYRVPRPEVAAQLCGLLQYKGIRNHDRPELLAALQKFGGTKLDFVDCLLLAKGRGEAVEILSFDAALKARVSRH